MLYPLIYWDSSGFLIWPVYRKPLSIISRVMDENHVEQLDCQVVRLQALFFFFFLIFFISNAIVLKIKYTLCSQWWTQSVQKVQKSQKENLRETWNSKLEDHCVFPKSGTSQKESEQTKFSIDPSGSPCLQKYAYSALSKQATSNKLAPCSKYLSLVCQTNFS